MTPSPYSQNPIPERVAVLEAVLPAVQAALVKFDGRLDHQEGMLNTLMTSYATLTQALSGVIQERSRWKDPMLYITMLSVVIAVWSVTK